MPSLLDIVTHTPPVVWGALALLILVGLRQMRTQTMSAAVSGWCRSSWGRPRWWGRCAASRVPANC